MTTHDEYKNLLLSVIKEPELYEKLEVFIQWYKEIMPFKDKLKQYKCTPLTPRVYLQKIKKKSGK